MDETEPGKIQKLDEAVINRIAAGEVIQRPANALKELLENSLDAGATNIMVTVKSGGMKLLQIQDDGSGIRQEDLSIVCERFTTSKLRTFEDLQSIDTYGFRGEALASISHVAHLTIITKTSGSACAYRAEYTDGKLKEHPGIQNPKPCAGKIGTSIIVEDLFYNMDTRRRALKNATDEHNKILEVVTRYAVHNPGVGFTLKKFGETLTDMRTPSKSNVLDNIRILYGSAIARELVEVSCEDAATKFRMSGYVSNVNYSTKKLMCILFINNRLVDSSALRKSVEAVYSNYLPKGSHPFLYLSIDIDPKNVDVNVHPTKHEVHFLHEDSIVSSTTSAIENTLLGSNESRTYFIQSLLPGASTSALPSTSGNAGASRKRKDDTFESLAHLSGSKLVADPKNMIRTDPKLQKLDKFLTSTPNRDMSFKGFGDSISKLQDDTATNEDLLMDSFATSQEQAGQPKNTNSEMSATTKEKLKTSRPGTATEPAPTERREIKLRSVRTMKEHIENDCHEGLLEVFRNHSFIGSVNRTLAIFQHETSLFITNVYRISAEFFYQKMVFEFGNLGKINVEDPISIMDLATLAISNDESKWLKEGESVEQAAESVHKMLMSKKKMLEDYFSLSFNDEGFVTSLPMLIHNYIPKMELLPDYLMNLARRVDWNNEIRCFESFCHYTALFYAVPVGGDEENLEMTLNGHTWKWNIEHIVFPEIQKSFLPPKQFADDSTIVLLTTLSHLYKVFERC